MERNSEGECCFSISSSAGSEVNKKTHKRLASVGSDLLQRWTRQEVLTMLSDVVEEVSSSSPTMHLLP